MDIATSTNIILALVVVVLTLIIAWYTRIQGKVAQSEFFDSVTKMMEDTRRDRHIIRAYVNGRKSSNKPVFLKPEELSDAADRVSQLPKEVSDAADRVSRAYDYLGLLDRNRLVDHKLIDFFYSVPLVKLWDDLLGDYVTKLTDPKTGTRDKTHLWELRQFYEQVKNVPANHPEVAGKKNWPRNPRRKHRKSVRRTHP